MLKHFHLGRRTIYPVLIVGLVVLSFALLLMLSNQSFAQSKSLAELLIASTGFSAAVAHFLYSKHHQDTQIFISVFEKFNARYGELNEKLSGIIARPIGAQLTSEDYDTLNDYFNLCAEEYLFFESGYIDEKVWRAWLRGMEQFARDEAVRQRWEQEIDTGSYYNFKLSLLNSV